MAVVIASTTALSVSANSKSAEQVSGQYQYVGKGDFTLACRGSATGLNVTCAVGGIQLVDDQPIPYTGAAGGLALDQHVMTSQSMAGGRVQLTFRNTTGGALTVDTLLLFTPR
tara:strand:- start:1913 stop:2251 length:339 start_codon:yes stop_codon:yes gene_type:complete